MCPKDYMKNSYRRLGLKKLFPIKSKPKVKYTGPAMDQKIARIQSLHDEVKELHPLLQRLLPLLPNVSRVEHTHGPNEKGADFIVVRSDPIVGGDEFVGVIVKSGDIRQNLDDVERQIKECEIARHIDGGKKKIVLSEIWVVASGVITNNAQEKINHQYADKKVKFLWSERIVSLLDQYYPAYWENVDANVGLYLGAVSRQVDDLNLRTGVLDVSLTDFYVDQDLVRVEFDVKKKFTLKSKSKVEQLPAILEKEQFVLIEAPMGYGKSRLLRQCAKEFSNGKRFADKNILPVFLSFRDLLNKYDWDLSKALNDLEKVHKINWKEYSVLFLVDGVDEIKGAAEEKGDRICNFISQANAIQNLKVVFATRPFEDPSVQQTLDKYLTRYALQPLTMQRIYKFVERICTDIGVASRLKRDLQKSDLFKSLPRSPISAILLGRVLATDIKELPSSLPELYSKYLDLAIGKWDLHKGIGSEKEYETVLILLRLLSEAMLNADLPEMTLADAEAVIADYLGKRETGLKPRNVLEKILEKNEVIDYDQVRNVIYFRHRSFLEYMYADNLYIQNGKTAELPSPFDPYWGAVTYFYLGRLKDCPDQLKKLFSMEPDRENSRLLRFVNAGNYLLASYQSPYQEISACVKSTIFEMANSYCQICEDPESTPLGRFSEIQLLSIYTELARNAFEYDFFAKALMETETDLLLSVESEKWKSIAVFFVSSIRAGLGCTDAFTPLVESHYSALPQSIRLGISHAAEDVGLINDAIRRLRKKIDKSERDNVGVRRARAVLYNVPLSSRDEPRLV